VERIVKEEEKEEDKIQRPIFLCHSRGSGNPESVQLFKNTGFPFPDQVEDRFHGNDKKD